MDVQIEMVQLTGLLKILIGRFDPREYSYRIFIVNRHDHRREWDTLLPLAVFQRACYFPRIASPPLDNEPKDCRPERKNYGYEQYVKKNEAEYF